MDGLQLSAQSTAGPARAGGSLTGGAARPARLRVRLGWADYLLQLWRAKWLMALVFLPLLLAGLAISLMMPVRYVASTRLLVQPGEAYGAQALGPQAGPGLTGRYEAMLLAEAELAHSPVIAERAIRRIGLAQLYPRLGEARLRDGGEEGYRIDAEALEAFDRDFTVSSVTPSPVLRMTFSHEQPELAAATLNVFTEEYLGYRLEVASGRGAGALSAQRDITEQRLAQADRALQDYLRAHGLGDFDAEAEAAARLFSELSDEQARVEASLREAEARVAGLSRQLATTPREADLYVETTSEQDLTRLRLEREDLLTRYLPDSRAVQDIDRRIAQLAAYLAAGPAGGVRRRGPNPTYQALEADRAVEMADISALGGRARALVTQKQATQARISELAGLEPDYRRLRRERDSLDASASALAARDQSERARTELARRNVDNVSIYEPARAPARSEGLQQIIPLAAAFIGMLMALLVGFARSWSVRTLSSASSLERTLGLPVLAATRER